MVDSKYDRYNLNIRLINNKYKERNMDENDLFTKSVSVWTLYNGISQCNAVIDEELFCNDFFVRLVPTDSPVYSVAS